MFFTYVLKSLKNNRFYIGFTNNLVRRVKEHNIGKSRYTRSTRPYILIHTENFTTRKKAVRRELFLKTGKGREWLKSQFG